MNHRLVAGLRAMACTLALVAFVPSGALAAPRIVSNARAADLSETARSLPRGAALRIEGTTLDENTALTGLDLVRFEPAAANAKFFAQGVKGARELHPDLPVYYRGSVDGMNGSVAVLGFRSNGEIRGIVTGADGTWVIGREVGRGSELRSKKVKKRAGDPNASFTCEQVESTGPRRSKPASINASASLAETRVARLPLVYTAQIAVELDYDFYQLFDDENDAVLYALDLMAFTGSLGESEFGMNVQVPYLILWTDTADPFSGGELNRLGQLRNRWNEPGKTNCAGVDCTTIPRSTVIVMSAAGSGGVAYIPALCDWYHSATNGFSYASAGSMDGNFNIDSPSVVWDAIVVTHELGHNFGSPHTHCYNPPIDECYSGEMDCHQGGTSLPSGCPGNGQGCGTIMGYCHRLTGGLSNVSLTFGAGHPYGNTPQRVPDTIIDQIELEAGFAPACLSVTDGMVELEITKNGNGNGTVTSSSGGIDCGSVCHSYIDAGEPVTLTATPTAFSEFAGWSGDPDCADGVIEASSATSCIATFNGSCGLVLGVDCEDHDPCTTDSCPGDLACVNSAAPRDESTCFTSPLTRFKVTSSSDPTRNKLQWQWLKGEAFEQADLGSPTETTDYAICLYDMNAGTPSLATSLALPAGSSGWRDRSPDGWKFSEKEGLQDGFRKMDMRTGIGGKSRIKLKAGGAALPMATPAGAGYFNQDPSIVVQLLSSDGSCWTSEFPAASGTTKNSTTGFSATGH